MHRHGVGPTNLWRVTYNSLTPTCTNKVVQNPALWKPLKELLRAPYLLEHCRTRPHLAGFLTFRHIKVCCCLGTAVWFFCSYFPESRAFKRKQCVVQLIEWGRLKSHPENCDLMKHFLTLVETELAFLFYFSWSQAKLSKTISVLTADL